MRARIVSHLEKLRQYSINRDHEKACEFGEKCWPKIKNRTVREPFANLLALNFQFLKDYEKANYYFLQSLAIRPTREIYYKVIGNLLDEKKSFNLRKAERVVIEALKYFPNETNWAESMILAAANAGWEGKALSFIFTLERWDLASIYARYLAIWDILSETDLLLWDSIQKEDCSKHSIPFALALLHVPLLRTKDSLRLIGNIIRRIYAEDLASPELAQEPEPGGKLKIGYLSADFFAHATMLLFMRVLELHNTDEFEIHLFYLNEEEDDIYRDRLRAVNCKRHFLHGWSTTELAHYIAEQKLHILVDLKGYTKDSCIGALARRPAKIIASWLGYPGSMAVEKLADYIIGDPVVTPLEKAADFTEKLALMPYSYQPNDNTMIAPLLLRRKDVGLPQDKFVFCSFNQIVKLNPEQFDFWCLLLKDLPNSVLWLLVPRGDFIRKRLLMEAEKRGIGPERFIFTRRASIPEHMSRLPLADMALDSFPYTSHTTASDALRAGVPLIAQYGQSFAARVSSSLVSAMGCPELIARNEHEAYEKIMLLAKNPPMLQGIREHLYHGFKKAPLFNSLMFTRDLERLYKRMWENYQKGVKDHIVLEPQDCIEDSPTYHETCARYDKLMRGLYEAKYGD